MRGIVVPLSCALRIIDSENWWGLEIHKKPTQKTESFTPVQSLNSSGETVFFSFTYRIHAIMAYLPIHECLIYMVSLDLIYYRYIIYIYIFVYIGLKGRRETPPDCLDPQRFDLVLRRHSQSSISCLASSPSFSTRFCSAACGTLSTEETAEQLPGLEVAIVSFSA